MSESVSVNLKSVVSGGGGTNNAGNSSTIEGLKKKLVSLQQDLRDAIGEQNKAGMAKAKLIQMQIQVTQARLQQLIQQQAQQAMKENKTGTSHLATETRITPEARLDPTSKKNDSALGTSINEFA